MTRSDCFFDALDIVELHHAVDIDTMLPQKTVDLTAYDDFLVKGDEILPIQILRGQSPLAGQVMAGRERNGHGFIAPGDDRHITPVFRTSIRISIA